MKLRIPVKDGRSSTPPVPSSTSLANNSSLPLRRPRHSAHPRSSSIGLLQPSTPPLPDSFPSPPSISSLASNISTFRPQPVLLPSAETIPLISTSSNSDRPGRSGGPPAPIFQCLSNMPQNHRRRSESTTINLEPSTNRTQVHIDPKRHNVSSASHIPSRLSHGHSNSPASYSTDLTHAPRRQDCTDSPSALASDSHTTSRKRPVHHTGTPPRHNNLTIALIILSLLVPLVLVLHFEHDRSPVSPPVEAAGDNLPYLLSARMTSREMQANTYWVNHVFIAGNQLLVAETFESRFNAEVAPVFDNHIEEFWGPKASALMKCPQGERTIVAFSVAKSGNLPASISFSAPCKDAAVNSYCRQNRYISDIRDLVATLPTQSSRFTYFVRLVEERKDEGDSQSHTTKIKPVGLVSGPIEIELSDVARFALQKYCGVDRKNFAVDLMNEPVTEENTRLLPLYKLKLLYGLLTRTTHDKPVRSQKEWDKKFLSRAYINPVEHSTHSLTLADVHRILNGFGPYGADEKVHHLGALLAGVDGEHGVAFSNHPHPVRDIPSKNYPTPAGTHWKEFRELSRSKSPKPPLLERFSKSTGYPELYEPSPMEESTLTRDPHNGEEDPVDENVQTTMPDEPVALTHVGPGIELRRKKISGEGQDMGVSSNASPALVRGQSSTKREDIPAAFAMPISSHNSSPIQQNSLAENSFTRETGDEGDRWGEESSSSQSSAEAESLILGPTHMQPNDMNRNKDGNIRGYPSTSRGRSVGQGPGPARENHSRHLKREKGGTRNGERHSTRLVTHGQASQHRFERLRNHYASFEKELKKKDLLDEARKETATNTTPVIPNDPRFETVEERLKELNERRVQSSHGVAHVPARGGRRENGVREQLLSRSHHDVSRQPWTGIRRGKVKKTVQQANTRQGSSDAAHRAGNVGIEGGRAVRNERRQSGSFLDGRMQMGQASRRRRVEDNWQSDDVESRDRRYLVHVSAGDEVGGTAVADEHDGAQ